jgi:hypothetical protein
MAQQQSPWIEGAYGWNFGEGGWNTGMDSNLLKFSFMFDRNVDSVVASLPAAVNGQAHYLTTDNRLYFAVGTTYFSTPTPKWFEFKDRSTGNTYQFNGTATTLIDSPVQLDSRLDAVELTVSTLGTAAFEDVAFFATQAELDVAAATAAAYTDTLRSDLAEDVNASLGAGLVGIPRRNGLAGRTVAQMSAERVSIEDFRIPGQIDWTDALADAAAYMIAQSQDGTPKILEFNANEVYEATVMPNWRWHNMWLRGNGATLKNTGTGDTLICDAGATTFQLRNVSITGFKVQGAAGSGHGVFIRGINASEFDVEVRGCGTAAHAFQCVFTVLNEYRFKASSIAFPFADGAIPLRGLVMGERDPGEKCSACLFPNIVIEGVAEHGILLQGALQNTFMGGTSESNGTTNVECQSVAFHNQFIGMDIEQSGTSQSIVDAGRWNRWTNIYADELMTIGATAIGTKVRDSIINSVDDQGLGSTFDCVDYNINAGTFVLSGSAVNTQETRRVRNTTSGTFLPSKLIDVSIGPAGQTIKRHNHAAVAIAEPPVPGAVPGTSIVSGVSVPGAAVNDTCLVTSGHGSNFFVQGVVTAANTVQIRWTQLTGAAASPLPGGGTVRIDTWGH